METVTVTDGAEEFVEYCSQPDSLSEVLGEDTIFGEENFRELWDIWNEYQDEYGGSIFIVIPEWFSENEFGKSRPFLFGTVEYDDESSGAVLFSNVRIVNKSIVLNCALSETTAQFTIDELVESNDRSAPDNLIDITDSNDYVDEAGKIWIPRSQMVAFERTY